MMKATGQHTKQKNMLGEKCETKRDWMESVKKNWMDRTEKENGGRLEIIY